MSWRAVFHALIGSYLRHEKGRTLLTVLGVALGVAVLVAIDLANESAVSSFRSTVRNVAGSAQLTVRGNGVGLPGGILRELVRRPEVEGASPLISGYATYSAPDGGTTETLLLLGVDFLRTTEPEGAPVRDLRFSMEPGRDLASLLTATDAGIFTNRFLERHGATLGDHVPLLIGGLRREMVAAGTIDGGAFAGTYDGNLLLVDVGIADILLRREGRLDRVDLTLREGTDIERFREELQRTLPGSVLVERPEARNRMVEEMIAAFRFNLRALGYLSVLVGAFLIYNTMGVAVVRRRTAIGTIRAMGVGRGTVRSVFLAEGALLGLAGSLLGIAAGIGAAWALLGTVSNAISINFFRTHAAGVVMSPAILLAALALGVGGALLAALEPANEAATTPPANTMRRGTLEEGARGMARSLLAGVALLACAGAAAAVPAGGRLPVSGYAAAVLLLAGLVCVAKPLLGLLCAILRRPFAMLFRGEGLLAVAGTQATLGRAGVAICGLLVSLAMTIAVSAMVSSFRETVTVWMSQVLVADLYITPASADGSGRPDPFPGALADRIRPLDGIDEIDPFRLRSFILNGKPASLGAGELNVIRFTNKAQDGRPVRELMREAAARGELVVSEAFSRKHGVAAGDSIPIPTPSGDVQVRIAGIYFDYSSEQGYAMMDRSLYRRYYDDAMLDSIAVYLEPGADRAAVRDAIQRAATGIPGMPPLVIQANDDLRQFALGKFDETFAVTYVLQVIALLVSVLGVTTTLLAQILDRRQEIATLRYLGASRDRVARVVLLESVLIGLTGLILGVLGGVALSWILTRVIMLQSFGWTIAFNVPWTQVAVIGAVVFGGTLLSALLPAREAAVGPRGQGLTR